MPYYTDGGGNWRQLVTTGFEDDKQYGGFVKPQYQYWTRAVNDLLESVWEDGSPFAFCSECELTMLKKPFPALGINADPMVWSVDSGEYKCLPCRDNLHTVEEITKRNISE